MCCILEDEHMYALVAHDAEVLIPADAPRVEDAGEFAVVIGRKARNLSTVRLNGEVTMDFRTGETLFGISTCIGEMTR